VSEPLPAAVALSDQWQAEVTFIARDLASTKLAEQGIPLNEEETDLLEAGYALGYAATLLVLERHGWLRKP
jgi:hypothetical protein